MKTVPHKFGTVMKASLSQFRGLEMQPSWYSTCLECVRAWISSLNTAYKKNSHDGPHPQSQQLEAEIGELQILSSRPTYPALQAPVSKKQKASVEPTLGPLV